MSYESQSVLKFYWVKFYNSNLFMALLVGFIAATMFWVGMRATSALQIPYTGAVTVSRVHSLSVSDEPSDIQPALGYRVLQNTYNVQ